MVIHMDKPISKLKWKLLNLVRGKKKKSLVHVESLKFTSPRETNVYCLKSFRANSA